MADSPRRRRKRALLDIRAVGQILGVGDGTVRKLVQLGHLRGPRMVAGSPRWFLIDVKVYLARLRSGEFDGFKIVQNPPKEPKTRQTPTKDDTEPKAP